MAPDFFQTQWCSLYIVSGHWAQISIWLDSKPDKAWHWTRTNVLVVHVSFCHHQARLAWPTATCHLCGGSVVLRTAASAWNPERRNTDSTFIYHNYCLDSDCGDSRLDLGSRFHAHMVGDGLIQSICESDFACICQVIQNFHFINIQLCCIGLHVL